jgi:hypothetical protein
MANQFPLKSNTTTGVIPSAGSLQIGELAINTGDGKLYGKMANSTVIHLNPAGGGGGGGTQSPGAIFGDGSLTTSIVAGQTVFVTVPYSGTITEWYIVADVSCSCTIDVWKANGAIPTNSNSIAASAKPNLSSSGVSSSSTLTGWTTTVASGDTFGFELESVTGSPKQITLTLKVA